MTDLRERVATGACAVIAREVRCGQSPDAPSDDPCKVTWLPYKRHCPECPLHHTQRMDVAREIADAAIAICREEFARVAEHAHLVAPDGGSPTDVEKAVADEAARRIRGQNDAV